MARRIAVVGNGGGGKSTAARELSQRLKIPCHSVDQVQFEPGWVRADLEKVDRWHAEILQHESWIIDGWGSWELIEARLTACDTILLIDFPLETHLEWATKRSQLSRAGQQPDAPPGCNYHEIDELMDETLRRVDREFMPRLRNLVHAQSGRKLVVTVHDPSQWRDGLDTVIGHESA